VQTNGYVVPHWLDVRTLTASAPLAAGQQRQSVCLSRDNETTDIVAATVVTTAKT
jgi:hypothetical protein